MDVMLFSKRLRRLLGGEETVTLPDEIKEQIQNLQKEIEFMTSFVRAHEYEIESSSEVIKLWVAQTKTNIQGEEEEDQTSVMREEELQTSVFGGGHHIQKMREIWYYVLESEMVLDTFFLNVLQNENESFRSEKLCKDLQVLERKIIDIRAEIEQLQHNQRSNSSNHEYSCSSSIALERKNIGDFIIKNKTRMVGREVEMREVLDRLIEGEPSLSRVIIVGEAGVGKRTFTAEVYDNIYVKSYFDCRAWIDCRPEDKVLDALLKSVMPLSRLSEIMSQDDQMKKTELGDYLRNKKYFIVFLDSLSYLSWSFKCDLYRDLYRHLKEILPDYNNGSRILMIIDHCLDTQLPDALKLERLNKKQSWEMLTDGEFGKEVSDLLDLETFKKTFEGVCQGLPAFIVRFRSLLVEKDKQVAISKMTNYLQGKSKLDFNIFILEHCYKNLPEHLKPCMIYLVVLLEKGVIGTRQLYLLWIAEGFVEDNSEATAEKYLEEMVIRGFIKVTRRSSRGKIKTCHFSSGSDFILNVLAACTGLFQFDYLWEGDPLCTCTRLLDTDEYTPSEETYSHLHSLLSYGDHFHGIFVSKTHKVLPFLKLLDLGKLEQCPRGIENLLLLRYLKMDVPSLTALPSSLCNLVNLFTLDMPSSRIEEVPDDFWKMQKLRHLNFAFIRLPAYPEDSCCSLKYLNFISALCASSCTQCLLGRLPNLRTLRIHGDLCFRQSELSKSLAKLQYLETLKMVNECKESSLLPMELDEYRFPPMLKHLTLSNTELKEDFMPILGRLPHLEVLQLKGNSYLGRKLACCSSGFPQLKVLHLKSMRWLEEWKMETGAMPKLECLVVNPCAYLRRLPEELWCINPLRKLQLWLPSPEMKSKLQEFEDMEQYDIQIYPIGL